MLFHMMTNTERRNEYRTIANACIAKAGITPAEFNARVERLMHELDDGEAPNRTPGRWLAAAQETAYYEFNVDYRTL